MESINDLVNSGHEYVAPLEQNKREKELKIASSTNGLLKKEEFLNC